MKPHRKICFLCLVVCVLLSVMSPMAHANSSAPPRLTVIVGFPPDDLQLSLRFEEGDESATVQLHKIQTAWETQYRFTIAMLHTNMSLQNATLVAVSRSKSFECPLPASALSKYDNVVSLDFTRQTVTDGQTLGRGVSLVSIRVLLTLLLEGALFFLLGYRSKRSWIAFLIINLITQGALNVVLNLSFAGAYRMFILIPLEILVLIIELIAFAAIIKEHRRLKTIAYVVVANLLSLGLGCLLISYLPV